MGTHRQGSNVSVYDLVVLGVGSAVLRFGLKLEGVGSINPKP